MFITYILKRDNGEAFYVGAGKENRPKKHLSGGGGIPAVINVIKEHRDRGSNILIYVDSNHESRRSAFYREVELIKEIGRSDNSNGTLVNLTDGGEGVSGLNVSQDRIRMMSEFQTERFKSYSERVRTSIATKKGMDCEEVRRKCKDGITKAWSNQEYRDHQVKAHTGHKDSDATKQKKAEAQSLAWNDGRRKGKYTDDQVGVVYRLKGIKKSLEVSKLYGMNPTYVDKIWRKERCKMALKRLGYL